METWQADSLAGALCQSFPRSSITADVWASELADLEQGRAEEAVRRLRRTAEHAPTVAAFYAVYNNLLGTAGPPAPPCDTCGDSGVVTDRDHPLHWPGRDGTIPTPLDADGKPTGECACNVATWCRDCEQGQRAKQTLRRMNPPAAA